MTEGLKPCPFCGGEARLLHNAKRKIYGKDEYKTGVVVCCGVCEARMFYGSEKLAIEAWNRRVEPERPNGEWIPHESIFGGLGEKVYTCNQCGYNIGFHTENFCPNCGADMRGEQDE